MIYKVMIVDCLSSDIRLEKLIDFDGTRTELKEMMLKRYDGFSIGVIEAEVRKIERQKEPFQFIEHFIDKSELLFKHVPKEKK